MTDAPPLVTSFANPAVKRFRGLAARKNRRREGAFTAEGLQPVWFAVQARWPVELLIVAPDLLTHEPSWQLVDEAERSGTLVTRVSREVFQHLSDRDGPAGLAAILSGVIGGIDRFDPAADGPVVALHRVANPGNIGAILRSADAAGAAGLLLIGPTADPLAPAAVKASMGSLFAVPVAHVDDDDVLFSWASQAGRPVVAITGTGSQALWQTPIPANAVLLFGSEGDGLPDDLARRSDSAVSIPMWGTAESLNLATAAAVTLFECARLRQHRADGGAR